MLTFGIVKDKIYLRIHIMNIKKNPLVATKGVKYKEWYYNTTNSKEKGVVFK
jgi:hypothetical protein